MTFEQHMQQEKITIVKNINKEMPGFEKYLSLILSYNGEDLDSIDLESLYTHKFNWIWICKRYEKELPSLIKIVENTNDYYNILMIDYVDEIRFLTMLPGTCDMYGELVSTIIDEAKKNNVNYSTLISIVSELAIYGRIYSYESFECIATYDSIMNQALEKFFGKGYVITPKAENINDEIPEIDWDVIRKIANMTQAQVAELFKDIIIVAPQTK